jgi:hypothetical protein
MATFKNIKLYLAALAIPLGNADQWKVLEFRKIKPNVVQFNSHGMRIEVDGSGGPIVHKLAAPVRVRSLSATGRYSPKLKLPVRQGDKKADDFAVRIGLVVEGDKRLSWVKAKIAPKWVNALYQLAPKDMGIDRIEFINLVEDKTLLGQHRTHPKSDLLVERFVAVAADDGTFTLNYEWKQPLDVLAVWISSDGDDSGSKFTVDIQEISLTTAD